MINFSIDRTDQAIFGNYREHDCIEEYFSSLSESELLFVENKLLSVLFEKKRRTVLGITDTKRGVIKEVLTDMVSLGA